MGILENIEQAPKYHPADWQLEDIDYLGKRDYSANWSEMGCRKTTTALWLAQKLGAKRILVVTTKGGKGAYFDAVPRTLDGYRIFNFQATAIYERIFDFEFELDTVESVRQIYNSNCVILAHYHCFTNKSKVLQFLLSMDYDLVIVDEAHRIKEQNNQWTRNIKKVQTEHRHVMTGTGFINRPSEIWSLLNFLNRKAFSSYDTFRKRYSEIWNMDNGFEEECGVREDFKDEFRALVRTIGVRRTMREVHSEVSEPILTPYPVELNPTQRRMYNQIKTELQMLDQKGEPINSPNVLSMLSRLRQICVATPELVREYYDEKQERKVQEIRLVEPSSKLDAVIEILEGLEWDEEAKQQVVIFSNFKDPLELLKARLDKRGISYLHMQEKHNDTQRYQMWHDIFRRKEHQVFMSTLQLGGESINLTPAQYCIFLDRSWSPKDNAQAIGRLYRPGQKNVPQIIHINAIKTTDQRVEKVNIVKQGWFNEVFGDEA